MILTPENCPDHDVVGQHFAGYSSEKEESIIWFCDSYDPSCGYWMTDAIDRETRKNVSERAIYGTFWPADDRGDHWHCMQWGKRFSKETGRVIK